MNQSNLSFSWSYAQQSRQTRISFSSVATFGKMKVSGDDWVLANLNVVGYYRVNYDMVNWGKLLTALSTNHEVRPPDPWLSYRMKAL